MDRSYQGSNSCASPAAVTRAAGWQRAARRARLLSWLSLAYMAAEGAIAIIAAVIAGSVALLGFGLDSAIEGLASVIIVWRFTGTRTLSETAETRWPGIGLSIASLIVMPALGLAKRRLGARLGSGATAGEGTQNLLCAYLAAGVLAGLLANTVLGWWWLDRVVALGIAGRAGLEGIGELDVVECAIYAV